MYRTILLLLFVSGYLSIQGQNLLDEQGRKTGHWKVQHPNGRTLYEANFIEGKPVGEMIRYYDSGAVRARMMFDTILDQSYTSLFYPNGKLAAQGWYVEQNKDSVWTYYSEFDGTVRIREPYLEGKLTGEVQSFFKNGVISEKINWVQNIKQGPWKQYYNTGSMRLASQYENDHLCGSYEVFYADNILKVKGEYLDNLSTGTWSYYDESGKEIYTMEYLLGKPVDEGRYNKWIQDSLEHYNVITEPESIQQYEP